MPQRIHSFLAFIILLTTIGCYWNGPRDRVTDVEPHRIPLEWSKAVEPLGQAQAAHAVRYNVLYVADSATLPQGDGGMWFRFWDNGRVLKKDIFLSDRRPYDTPTADNADDFTGGSGCFYSTVGDNITIEYIGQGTDDEALMGPKNAFKQYSGRVNDDGSFTLFIGGYRSLFGRVKPMAVVCRPIDVGPMNRQPDW